MPRLLRWPPHLRPLSPALLLEGRDAAWQSDAHPPGSGHESFTLVPVRFQKWAVEALLVLADHPPRGGGAAPSEEGGDRLGQRFAHLWARVEALRALRSDPPHHARRAWVVRRVHVHCPESVTIELLLQLLQFHDPIDGQILSAGLILLAQPIFLIQGRSNALLFRCRRIHDAPDCVGLQKTQPRRRSRVSWFHFGLVSRSPDGEHDGCEEELHHRSLCPKL